MIEVAVQQMTIGERKVLYKTSYAIGKIDVGIRLSSDAMDVHTIVDIALVYKSRTRGINTIWYGNPQNEFVVDETSHCYGSSWNDDDLRISVDFNKIPSDIERMSIITNILWGKDLKQHYGLINKGYMHIYSHEEKSDIIEYPINWFEHKGKTGMIWAEIYPYKDEWKIKAIEESLNSKDLGELANVAGSYL